MFWILKLIVLFVVSSLPFPNYGKMGRNSHVWMGQDVKSHVDVQQSTYLCVTSVVVVVVVYSVEYFW